MAKRHDLSTGGFDRLMELELAPSVVEALEANRATPPSILARLRAPPVPPPTAHEIEAANANANTLERKALAEDPSTDATVLAGLARHGSSVVRAAVAARADAPRQVLELLARDSEPAVHGQATRTLDAMTLELLADSTRKQG